MNWDTIEGNWTEFKGRVKQRWGDLTDDDLDRIAGRRTELMGALQKRYGIARERAESEIRVWLEKLDRTADRVDARRPRDSARKDDAA